MVVVGWNSGRHEKTGAGYGVKINRQDRDSFFRKEWKSVVVLLPDGKQVEINIDKPSFWNDTCRELISKEIGSWLRSEGLAPWPKGKPPRFELKEAGEAKFVLCMPDGR